MAFTGIWAISTARIPPLLIGGPKYKLEGRSVRFLGILLLLPIPIALVGGFLLLLILGEGVEQYLFWLEIFAILGIGIIALLISRQIREPVLPTAAQARSITADPEIEAAIAKKAQGSLIYALLGGTGVGAIVFCPLAFHRANQALKMIDEHNVGDRFRTTARGARILASLIFLFWAAIAVCVLSGTL